MAATGFPARQQDLTDERAMRIVFDYLKARDLLHHQEEKRGTLLWKRRGWPPRLVWTDRGPAIRSGR